jgi:hypothetical protein
VPVRSSRGSCLRRGLPPSFRQREHARRIDEDLMRAGRLWHEQTSAFQDTTHRLKINVSCADVDSILRMDSCVTCGVMWLVRQYNPNNLSKRMCCVCVLSMHCVSVSCLYACVVCVSMSCLYACIVCVSVSCLYAFIVCVCLCLVYTHASCVCLCLVYTHASCVCVCVLSIRMHCVSLCLVYTHALCVSLCLVYTHALCVSLCHVHCVPVSVCLCVCVHNLIFLPYPRSLRCERLSQGQRSTQKEHR